MKKNNLIEMLQGCSMRNGMPVSASNPDGEPTVNRQSRLMSYQCSLRNLAMIFAILTLSIANIGTAWGESPYNLDITSAFSSTGNQSKNDGTVTISGYIQSKKYNNVESTKVAYLDGSYYLTVSATSACITSITVTANTDDNSNTHEVAYQTSADGSSWSASTNMGTCANRRSAPTSRTANFSPAVQYVRFTKGGSNKISVGAISITYTDGGGDPDPGDECTKIFWFAKAEDAKTAGVENNTSTFTGVVSGTSEEVSGTITIDGKDYSVTGRGKNGKSAITFTVPVNKTATLYGLASSSGSSARELTLTGPNEYSQVQSTSASSSTAGTITFTKMTAGNYSIAWGGKGAISMLCLKLCDAEPSCTAPNHVDIKASAEVDGYGRYTIGEDISLTATAYSSAGTGSPITSGITGYQWQKYVVSEWQNVTNEGNISGATTANLQISSCTESNVGSYQCIVSTGATCSTTSNSKMVRVYSLDGNYYGKAWTKNAITWTGNKTGTVTLNLDAKQVYEFKVRDNDGKEYGSGANNYVIQSRDSKDCGTGNVNVRLLTAPAGNYTFTIDITHAQDNSPYVNVVTNYPTVSHPNTGYVYVQKFNWTPRLHYWYNDANKLTDWENDPTINADQYVNICGTDYWYVPVINYYCNFIASDHGSNSTGDQHTNDLHPGQRLYNDGSWKWGEFTTYSISFNAGGGTGTMDAIEGICPSGSQVLTSNAFTAPSGCASFAHWIADVAVTANGSAVAAGNPIANGATIQNISSDITLTAVWKLATPTITDKGDNTFSISGSIGGASYYYTTDGSTPTTSSSLYSSAVDFSAGKADITAKAIAHKDGYVDSDVASQACTYVAPVDCPSSGTLYTAVAAATGDISIAGNTSDLELNTSTHKTTVTGGSMYVTSQQTESTNLITANGFTMTNNNTFFKIVLDCALEEGDVISVDVGKKSDAARGVWITTATSRPGSAPACALTATNASLTPVTYTVTGSDEYHGKTVLYIYRATANTTYFNNINISRPVTCTTPAAPTAFAAGSITSTGAKFTITDAGDAASYDIYYATSSSEPDAGTAATTTSDSKTKEVTGLTASTTYYAWVRSVCDADHKSAWVALSGSSFTTEAGGGCTQQSVVKTVLSSTTAGTTTGYNNDEYAGDPTIVTFESNPVNGGYKLKSNSKLFVTLKKGSFVAGDKINIVITKASDVNASTTGKLLIFYNASSPALLTTIDAASAGTYTYTLTASDITTLGSNKTIGVFRSSSTTENNPYVKSVEVEGCRDWTVDETAPTFVSSVPANGATDVATSGTIVLTFSEALGSVDESKFTLTGATKGTVNIDGSDATKVNITYTGAANSSTVTLATAAAAVSDVAGNALAAALSDISFTTAAAAPVRDCEDLVVVTATSTTAVAASVGTVVSEKLDEGNQFTAIDGYTYAVKPATSGKLTLSPKAGKSFAAGDSLIFIVHNGNSGEKKEGFKIGSSTHTHSVAGKSLYYIRIELTASDIVDGKVEITRNSSDDRWVAVIIKTCDVLPSCTTPELPSLSDQEVCAGADGTAWDATATNAATITAAGESIAYSWKKKGNDTELANTASYTPTDVTAADAGIYVVTATVSKTGNSDATASAEVTLTVKFTATPMVTMTPSSIAPGETATLTATSSEGATFQWFKCDNAAGDNPVNVVSTATYTTPALAVGSYYYKVVATGDGTHTCGTAELIYQVEVAIPEQCHTYYWFPYSNDAGTNDVTNNENNFFSGTKTGSSNGGTYKFSVDGESLTATKNTGSSSMTITFTIPSGKTGTLGINCKGSSSNPIYLTHSSGTPQTLISNSGSYGAFEVTDIAAGTYTVAAGASGGQSWTLSGMAVKVCTVCDATTMDVSNAAPTYDMSAGGDFTEPTFTVKHDGSALSPQPALSYTSSNSAIATVNETTGALTFHGKTGTVTITATYSGDGTYCSSTASYTLTINCGSEVAPKIVLADGTNLTGCNTTITLHAKKQDGTDFTGGTYQWYRNGDVIEGATDASYTVARAGTYIVTRTGACVQESTNKAVITNTVDEPTVERLVPFQYYHEDKEYSAQMKDRHLFAVHSQGTYEGKSYSMTATRVSDGADVLSIVEGALWVKPGTGAGVGTDTVMIDLNLLIDQGLAAGDEVRFVCSAIACGGISPVNNDIILKVIDQTPTLAIICSGADGDGTRDKANYVLHGDFLTGYNKADLCLQTGGTTFDNTQELPLYTALKAHYRITPVNGYAPFKLLNYEPFDLLLLTDFPKTKLGKDSDPRTAQATNKMDSMYVLVDYRPMLSFKTHMVAKTPSSWAVKGFTTSPTVPKTPQTHMNIVCYAHPMFNALSHLATDEVSPDHDEEGQMVYKMLTGGGYDKSKGIQGFELSDAGNFVTIAFTRYNATASAPAADGTVTWTPGAEDRKLIAACERQTNIEARMILLSINADALCKLTDAGIAMVDSTLQYLLESDPLKVADCSLTFDDKTGDGKWSTPGNWAPRYNQVPNADLGARIIKPCTVDNAEAIALSIKIEEEGKLIIPATSALIVESSIRHADGGNLSAPSADEISIAANASGSGTLILNNITEDTRASVQMYSKASTDQSADAANWRWQYIGTPFNDVTDAMTNYYGSWLYLWNNGWNAVPKSAPLEPFAGYCITHPDGARTYSMTGTLATTADQTITVPAEQYMVIANSWTAPIQIDNFTDDDLKNLAAKTIYFFNTGSDPNQSGTVQPAGVTGDARWAAGTYVPVPIHAAPYSGDSTISAMQGFYVVGGVSEGSIHLDYDRLVRPQKTGQNIVSGPMHVRRRAAAADGEPNVLKLFVGGNRYDDRLILLEREDFTNGFDDGWDGDKWSGNSVAPALWTLRNDNTHEAVSAIPDFEGTIIGFQAGEDDEYTFRFDYSGEADAIYLLDTETKVYTRVLTGNTYTFTTADNAEHQRFVLTRSDAPQVATGVEPTSDSSLKGRAKKLLIEDKLYILLNSMLYDATGKLVR